MGNSAGREPRPRTAGRPPPRSCRRGQGGAGAAGPGKDALPRRHHGARASSRPADRGAIRGPGPAGRDPRRPPAWDRPNCGTGGTRLDLCPAVISITGFEWLAHRRSRTVEALDPERVVKVALLTLTLVGCMLPCLVTAQPIRGCAACVDAAGCNTTHEACVAECRARLFSIDPRRSDCITGCSNNAIQCSRIADSACRARNLCN